MYVLTDNQFALRIVEIIDGYLEVKRCRTFSGTSRNVIVRTVAWTEPSSVITSLANGNATQVRADTQHHQPFRPLCSLLIRLGITQVLPICLSGLLDLIRGPVPDEHGLSAPFEDNILAFWDVGEFNFDFGHGQNISGCRHSLEETSDAGLGDRCGQDTHGANHEVRHSSVLVRRCSLVCGEVRDLGGILDSYGSVYQTGVGGGRNTYCFPLAVHSSLPSKTWRILWKVLETRPPVYAFETPPVNRAGLSERGPTPCPWSCPCDEPRAERLMSGTEGTPEGRARTVGARFTAFLTAAKEAMF